MENLQITQMDGEPPIYREMKPVPVTLESCILNNEDFPYSQAEQALVTKNSCDNDELSPEEINSMIMINEGPNALSSVQEELESSKVNSSLKSSSDIKKILTSDLPKAGRFLSTKSLQKLSGAKKIIKKNSRYTNEDETDTDDFSYPKVKKTFNKQNKAVKENLDKANEGRVEQKIARKRVKVDKLKIKSQKKKNSLEKLANKKKSLKAFKKFGINKGKDSTTKVFKKKVLENNTVVGKKEVISENEELKSCTEKTINKTSENENKKSKTEIKSKLLISRSGRIRKLKDISDFVLTKNKEGKILNPTVVLTKNKESKINNPTAVLTKSNEDNILSPPVVLTKSKEDYILNPGVVLTENEEDKISNCAVEPEMVNSPMVDTLEDTTETNKQSVPVECNFKSESNKESKFKGDLLQSALSESVESWFDITPAVEKKGKRTRGKVRIIPKDSDSCFEETENVLIEKNIEKIPSGNLDGFYADCIKSEIPIQEPKEVVELLENENKEVENDSKQSQNINKIVEVVEKEENSNLYFEEIKPKIEEEKKEEEKKSGAFNGKKVKPTNKQLMGYKKKRRKPKNIIVSSYLKNYGERIDFEVKLNPEEEEETRKENILEKNIAEETIAPQEKSIKEEICSNFEKKKKESEMKSVELVNTNENKCENHTAIFIKRSPSAESTQTPLEPKVESPSKSAEMPASVFSKEKDSNLLNSTSFSTDGKAVKKFENQNRRSRKTTISKKNMLVVKEEPESSSLNLKSAARPDAKSVGEQPLATVPSVENYLQSKMEANASNFESSWEPGDLVWARFAGNPFWPALILRDPFSNDEYSRVKYLGRLPRPFVHVQFLADYGRRAWGPELYIMNFNGLQEFEKLKSNLPEVNAYTQRKDLIYQQAFFTPKKMEKHWIEAVKEADTLVSKSKEERITYMKIKYPLVKYAESVTNGRLVPNERTKCGELKSPQPKVKKKRGVKNLSISNRNTNECLGAAGEDTLSKGTFECVNTSDMDEGTQKTEKDSPKITLKLVRSPKKGSKRKSSKSIDELEEKKIKKRFKKETLDDDYVPSDSGSNGEKGLEATTNKQKKYFLFKGARTEKVCQICLEILENEKTIKCKGACQGLFHKSCAEKMSSDLPPLEEGTKTGVKSKRRKKLFSYNDIDNSIDSQLKESTEKEWRCNDCLRGENPCFVCSSRSGNRQRCCVAYCGKFYHQKCLKLYPQTIYNQGAPIRKSHSLQQNKTTESESPHYQILSCPLHVCHTCASDNPADFNMKYLCEKLVKCIKCPSAYHGGNYCVPAGSTILNTSQIICAKHGDPGKKSHVNISWCFICNMGGSLICCEWCPSSFHLDCLNIKPPDGPYICEECESGRFPLYGEVVWVKLGRYRWWPARVLFPQEILPNIMALPHKSWEFAVRFYGSNDHYWLNRGRVFLYQEGDSEQKFKGQSHVDKIYQRAVQEATKDYFAIQEERKSRLLGTNTFGVMKPPPYVKIKTNKPVGKVQLGNPSQSEFQTCDCDPNSEAPCSPGSVCLNRMLLVECNPNYCNAGSRCENQSFEKREYPPLEPYRTERRGWGLRSPIDIPKGSFVIEYVGEVVDDDEFKRRMKRKQETKDSNYYFLTIDKDRMIDAGPKGNLARFMNHSCSPNCETQKWTVNGVTRVGLFALRDIPAGTELTFNYNLDCIGNEKKPCHCEEENCSGFIGVKAKNDKSEGLKNKMVKRLEKESEDECFVCNDGGELMLCDVPNCPKVYHVECVNLKEWPNEIWFCPRHRCSLCSRTTKRCCKLCPTAFCFAHLDNNMFPDHQGGLLCSKHSTCAVKPAQILRKASYVNRNTHAVEYEKPFAEKYRPPPQKDRTSPEEKKQEILMEPNLTDNTPIVVENPLLTSSTPNRLSDGVSVQVLYVDEEGQIVRVDRSASPSTGETLSGICDAVEVPKPMKRKKRTNIPRKKLNPPVVAEETENKQKSPTQGGINFESLMIKSVEDKILDSKLNMDNIYNIIGGGGENGVGQPENAERCIKDDGNDLKTETVNKKEDTEVDRSRRSKYFKIITPEKFIKVTESEPNQKKVTDFNYIEFMHPLRSARSKTKTDENTRK